MTIPSELSSESTENVENSIEEQAKLLRSFSQEVGISSKDPWDVISNLRRDQWRRVAIAMHRAGYQVVDSK